MVPSASRSPIAAMWVCYNPVDPAVDPRGRGYAPAAADRLVAFARAGRLAEVHLHAPVAADMDEYFDHEWVRSVFGLAVERLRAHYEGSGRER